MKTATKQLYLEDSYCSNFTAEVISCVKNDDFYNVVLDKTCFFPEGGGQKADIGKIGEVSVLDTQISDGIVIHKTDGPVPVNSKVECRIDWDIRFKRMQNHSAEHILSGVAYSQYGCNNVGFHMSDSSMTVDFDIKLSQDQINDIEIRANKAVFSNIPITVLYPQSHQAQQLQYRSKKDIQDNLRLVKIGNVDCCACCAPHVAYTGEIGLIKILDFFPYKSGTRLELVAGHDALEDYLKLNSDFKQVMKILSSPRDKIVEFVNKQVQDLSACEKEKQNAIKELSVAKMQVTKVENNAYSFCQNSTFDILRHCSNLLLEQGYNSCVLLSKADQNQYIYVINSKNSDITPILKPLNDAFNGKGGGKAGYAQGKLTGVEQDIEKLLSELLGNN